MDDLPPHNPLKLPFFCLTGLIGLGLAVFEAFGRVWWLVVWGAVVFVASAYLVRLIHQDRRYRWFVSPMDKHRRRRSG